jgi:hypothetical protein
MTLCRGHHFVLAGNQHRQRTAVGPERRHIVPAIQQQQPHWQQAVMVRRHVAHPRVRRDQKQAGHIARFALRQLAGQPAPERLASKIDGTRIFGLQRLDRAQAGFGK